MASSDPVPRGNVVAKLNFFQAPSDGSEAENLIQPHGLPKINYTEDPREVLIQDLRGRESDVALERDGVAIVHGLDHSAELVFVDDESIRANYYPELRKILLDAVPGSHTVFFFDYTIRRADPKAPRNPVTRVHIDQTATSVIQRIRKHLSEDAEKLLSGRCRLINVWKSLNVDPVESFPLAFALSPSVQDEDIVPIHHRYPNGYTGQTAGVRFAEGQQWRYVSGMTPDERLLLQCFDGQDLNAEGARGARLAHTAFEDPRTRSDAVRRESSEVRALVFGP
ncbi:methyltransferase [Thelonectria olida]|uniref:Methyltransferase n=1 Tax=Thelonectria olida TaxID=1576542 RepID=A0A9P8WB99_9HYPO|nr:methyltransferase [Thelonectria olida]